MREIVVFCCLAAGASTVDWRAALDLDETPYVQRARSAGWRADLAAALDFDLASLGSAHALAQSQVSKEGWLATHARWVERSPCGGAAVARAAPGTERARRDVPDVLPGRRDALRRAARRALRARLTSESSVTRWGLAPLRAAARLTSES